ncbi:MAG: cell envelope integrity protein TolA [Gammaproteobacteria bacterium]
MWQAIRENPRAVTYAVLMHLVLLVLLVISLDWTPKVTTPARQPIQARLVDSEQLEATAKQRQLAEDKRKAELAAKEKAAAEKKRKAELAVKEKAAVEQKQKAELAAKQKAAAEKKQKAELAAKEKAAAEAKLKAEQEAKEKAAAAVRQREAEQALQAQLAAEQEEERAQGVVSEYVAYIQEKVTRNWLRPAGSPRGLSCVVQVSLIPGGDVAGVKVIKGSGDAVFDRSVETAVYKAAPLPLPKDPAMFSYFRDLRFVFKPS